jgi:hypothetical protein
MNCAPELKGVKLGTLETGSTRLAGMLPKAGTDGQDSSEAAADAEVKGGVVTFYGKLVRHQEITDIASVRVKIKIYVLCQPKVL